jgi:Tol biopolymer transport system component
VLRRALILCAGLLAGTAAEAQTVRPALDWYTVETENFTFHFPEQYRAWTLAVAARMEGIRTQVGQVVGYLPPTRVHIVVDDPANDPNGTALTTLDAPTIVLYPTPPDPREEIGNFRVWGELLATHEFAHVAHLNRPSRNRLRNLYLSLSPVPLGPIPVDAPRWALEGYATYVEGKVTGTGRPNHAWRAAVLRQFALEGRLPSYGQLSATGPWQTGNFAYLAGSAFLEWLARREGDSSLTAVWRRMTAKTVRSFDEAFVGVYGDSPAALYGRFAAELTAGALAFERALGGDLAVKGTLVQRLVRETGDPAISPDGHYVALTQRHTDAPSALVVWKTADEPDTSAASRRARELARDPEDVPARAFYPPPRHDVISLMSSDGAPYESPRWMPDNKHLLVTRLMPLSDGALRPDIFLWSAEDGSLRRLTVGAALRNPDPSSDGRWAAAVRCDHGWCDLVRVDLGTGLVTVLVPGSETRNYYRPRVSRRTGEIVVSEQSGDRWRVAVVSPESGALRYIDPSDGATRYDAVFDTDGRTVIATSEARGIANLERLDRTDGPAIPLTSVTGAAVAPDVSPDGSIWFLSLQASGYDLRRLESDSTSTARAAHATAAMRAGQFDSLSAAFPPRATRAPEDSTLRPRLGMVGEVQPYGLGPSRFRYFPALTTGYGGSSVLLSVLRTDPVGRLGVVALGAFGAGALPAGASLNAVFRGERTERWLSLWTSHESPSALFTQAAREGLNLTRSGGALRLQRLDVGDGGEMLTSGAVLAERQYSDAFNSVTRGAVIAGFSLVRRQRDEDTRYVEQLSAIGETGLDGGVHYLRQRTTLGFGAGGTLRPLTTLRVSYGSLGGGGDRELERFVIGGFQSPLIDPLYDGRRVDAPAYPLGSADGNAFASFRVMMPIPPLELFYSGASTDLFHRSFRSYGLELRERVGGVPALGTPDLDVLAGFARAVDAPVAREWRYYLSFAIRP